MKLIVVRHGQTDWNLHKILQGQINTELNDTGIKEATITAKLLHNESIDKIIASPLHRAASTAQIINQTLALPLHYDERLIERSFGTFEKKTFTQESLDVFWEDQNDFSKEGVESLTHLRQRVYSLLDELIESHETILIVTHGVISVIIAEYFSFAPLQDYPSHILKNCEIAHYFTDSLAKISSRNFEAAAVSGCFDK